MICTVINLTAFVKAKNAKDLAEFFGTRDDAVCSTITILYTCFLVYFPVYAYKYIMFYSGKYDSKDAILEVLMEGVYPRGYHSAMYTVYFLVRRLMTGILLVLFVDYPFFQCAFLLVFSTINFIYVVTVRPLEDAKQNRIEVFNELSIMLCAHTYNIFLRGEGTIGFINGTGWMFMGTASFNILGNSAVVVLETIQDAASQWAHRKQEKQRLILINERRENRESIVQEAPGTMKQFEFEISIHEVLEKVKAWTPHRRWLLANKVKISEFPEEIEYKALVAEYKLLEKAEYGRMTKSIVAVAERRAAKEMDEIRSKNALIRHR